MVGLRSVYASRSLTTFSSTVTSLDKCTQFGFTHVSLSRHKANSVSKSGFLLRTSTNKDPEKLTKTVYDARNKNVSLKGLNPGVIS